MLDFINSYYKDNEYFYVFMLSRTETYINKKGIETAKTREYLHNKESFEKYYKTFKKMNENYNWDFYTTVNIFSSNAENRYNSEVIEFKSFFFDIDIDARETAERIIAGLGKPSYFVKTSSSKYQLIYELETTIKGNITELQYYSLLLKKLTKYYKTDNTFDLARVCRIPEFTNNKNGFKTTYKKFKYKYTIKHFEDFIKSNNIEIKEEKQTQKRKLNINNNDVVKIDNIDYKKYLIKYNSIKKRTKHNDLSRIDASFIKSIRSDLNYSYEAILSVLKYCRKDLMTKHSQDIERYITLKIELS